MNLSIGEKIKIHKSSQIFCYYFAYLSIIIIELFSLWLSMHEGNAESYQRTSHHLNI